MSVEEHKTMIHHLFEEALNRRNVAVIDELFATHFVDHSAWPGQAPGPAGTKQGVADIPATFPHLHVTVESIIADGG